MYVQKLPILLVLLCLIVLGQNCELMLAPPNSIDNPSTQSHPSTPPPRTALIM